MQRLLLADATARSPPYAYSDGGTPSPGSSQNGCTLIIKCYNIKASGSSQLKRLRPELAWGCPLARSSKQQTRPNSPPTSVRSWRCWSGAERLPVGAPDYRIRLRGGQI